MTNRGQEKVASLPSSMIQIDFPVIRFSNIFLRYEPETSFLGPGHWISLAFTITNRSLPLRDARLMEIVLFPLPPTLVGRASHPYTHAEVT